MKVYKFIVPLLLLTSNVFAFDPSASVDAQPRNATCARNYSCIVATQHWAQYINKTGSPKTIFVSYRICPDREECKTDTYRIVVGNGTWHDTKMMTTSVKYHYDYKYALNGDTTIMDENHNVLNTIRRKGMISVHG
jgi:hypothetical protein